jgi:hypothetical protein
MRILPGQHYFIAKYSSSHNNCIIDGQSGSFSRNHWCSALMCRPSSASLHAGPVDPAAGRRQQPRPVPLNRVESSPHINALAAPEMERSRHQMRADSPHGVMASSVKEAVQQQQQQEKRRAFGRQSSQPQPPWPGDLLPCRLRLRPAALVLQHPLLPGQQQQ